MASYAFVTNPIGMNFDPEVLVRRLQSGESNASIKTRIVNSPRVFEDHLFN
jgi:hypothetical protein